MHERLLSRFRPPSRTRPRSTLPVSGVTIRWLGTAGHVIQGARTTIAIDPFLSRPSPLATVLRPLVSDASQFSRYLPNRIDAVALGHSHFDHLLDAPSIAKLHGSKLLGSRTSCSFARAEGVPEGQLIEVPAAGETVDVGDAKVTFVPSLHGRIALGKVPFAGEVSTPPRVPARFHEYRMGGAFGVLVEIDGVRIYHNGSADLVDAEVAGLSADVVLVGLAGRRATPRYLERLLTALRPDVVIPTHHDSFFAPLDRGVRLLPGVDFDGFLRETADLSPRSVVLAPDYEDAVVVGAGVARDATLTRWG